MAGPQPPLPPVPNRDLLLRLSYTQQAATYLHLAQHAYDTEASSSGSPSADVEPQVKGKQRAQTISDESDPSGKCRRGRKTKQQGAPGSLARLARSLASDIPRVTSHNKIRLDPGFKRALCRTCHTVLLPGLTAQVITKPSRTHGHVVATTCTHCTTTKTLPRPPLYPLPIPVETLLEPVPGNSKGKRKPRPRPSVAIEAQVAVSASAPTTVPTFTLAQGPSTTYLASFPFTSGLSSACSSTLQPSPNHSTLSPQEPSPAHTPADQGLLNTTSPTNSPATQLNYDSKFTPPSHLGFSQVSPAHDSAAQSSITTVGSQAGFLPEKPVFSPLTPLNQGDLSTAGANRALSLAAFSPVLPAGSSMTATTAGGPSTSSSVALPSLDLPLSPSSAAQPAPSTTSAAAPELQYNKRERRLMRLLARRSTVTQEDRAKTERFKSGKRRPGGAPASYGTGGGLDILSEREGVGHWRQEGGQQGDWTAI